MKNDIIKLNLYGQNGYVIDDGFISDIYIYDDNKIIYKINQSPMIGLIPLNKIYPNKLDHLKCFSLNKILSFFISTPVAEKRIDLTKNYNFYIRTICKNELNLHRNYYDLYIHASDVFILEEKEIKVGIKQGYDEFSTLIKMAFKNGPLSIESINSFGGSTELRLPNVFIWSKQIDRKEAAIHYQEPTQSDLSALFQRQNNETQDQVKKIISHYKS